MSEKDQRTMNSTGATITTILIAALILVLNSMATRSILRDDLSERNQRLSQLLLTWLVPILGALLVITLHGKPAKHSGHYPIPRDEYESCDWAKPRSNDD